MLARVRSNSTWWADSSPLSSTAPTGPSTKVRGVRNSWLTLAKKRDFSTVRPAQFAGLLFDQGFILLNLRGRLLNRRF